MLSSSSVAAATDEVAFPAEDDSGQAVSMPAPFACNTEWQGTTYSGHGAHNWNLDLNRSGDDEGTDLGEPILAQADGVVVWFKASGYNNRAGTYIEIDYGEVTARYLHLVEGSIPEPLAEVGALVERGDVIGLLGATGRASGPHLHLEYWDSADFDDTSRYELPRANQLPVVFDGQEMIAEPGHPSPIAVSTNCSDAGLMDRWLEVRSAATTGNSGLRP